MNIISKIAKAELRTLFYSPIAWVVFISFFIIISLRFAFMQELMVNMQEHNLETMPDWTSWDDSLTFQMLGHLTEPVIEILYLFIPLLTMGIMNREVNNGTIKLLYSSPIRPRAIVFGKFIGTLIFLTTFALAIGGLMLASYLFVENAEYRVFLSVLLGFYLLAGAYVAIGIFISSLTHYQIVAGIATFVVLYLLQVIGSVWQQYDFIRDITNFLSISGRTRNMMTGLITSRDLLYFLLIILLFLSFSIIKLQGIREKGGWQHTFKKYALVTVGVLMLGYFSSRPGYIAYLDVTKDQLNTIHPVTQQTIARLGDEVLTVTLYTNLFDQVAEAGLPQNRNRYIWNFWEKYVRFHPNVKFKYVYYYDLMDHDTALYKDKYPGKTLDEVAKEIITAQGLPQSLFMKPAEIRKLIDLTQEDRRTIMQLEYKGRKAFLRTYPDANPWPDEKHVSGSICRLLDSVPTVLFTSGHHERSPYKLGEREYGSHTLFKISKNALLNLGVDVDTINLLHKNLPADLSVLVVGDPKSALSLEETDKINNYVASGGNVIFYGEPGKQDILNPLLQSIGVHIDKGTIVYPNEHEMPHIIISPITVAGVKMADEPMLYYSQVYSSIKPMLQLPGAAALSVIDTNGFTAEPIFSLKGNDGYWIENSHLVVDSAAPKFSVPDGDLRKDNYITGVKITRPLNNKEQRIVVTTDADFMSGSRNSGQSFANAAYSWCIYNKFPKYTNRPKPRDVLFTIGSATATTFFRVYIYLIPAIIIFLGIVILVKRMRK